MRVAAARWLLSLLLLCGLIGPPAFAVGLKETAALESLRIGLKADEAEFPSDSSSTGNAQQLATFIDAAIDDVIAMPVPRDKIVLQMRLQILLDDTKIFAVAQRQQAAHYAVKIWRAAGFTDELGLLSVSDQEMLERP